MRILLNTTRIFFSMMWIAFGYKQDIIRYDEDIFEMTRIFFSLVRIGLGLKRGRSGSFGIGTGSQLDL